MKDERAAFREYYGLGRCRAGKDGECCWSQCPQVRDKEPEGTGKDTAPWMLRMTNYDHPTTPYPGRAVPESKVEVTT
jgi:hypothetical protein